MPWNRQTRGLTQRKQEKPQIKKNRPLKSEGNDGDISIRQLKDGVFLFFKALGRWYKTLNTSSQVIPEPDAPRSLALGASGQPVESMYISSNSLHIGNTKANTLKLGIVGTGENVRLQAKTPSGNVVADTSVNLSQVDGNVVLTLTDSTYDTLELSFVSDGSTLELADGATFTVGNQNDEENNPNIDENTATITTLEDRVAALEASLAGTTSHGALIQSELSDNPAHTRVDKRLRFDAEMAWSLSNIHTKFDWIKTEIGGTNTGFYNNLVAKLGENVLNPIEVENLTIPRERATVGGTWTFAFTGGDYEDLWTSSEDHGLNNSDQVLFANWGSYPQEFFGYKAYYVIKKSNTTIQLKNVVDNAIVEGTSNSVGTWKLTYAWDINATLGGLNWSEEYSGGPDGNHKPALVEGETYTTGGVCSLSNYHTEDSCIRAGGTWYPTETI